MNIYYRIRENGKIQVIISYKLAGEWKQASQGGFDRKKDAKDWAKKKSFELMELERLNIIDSEMTLDDVFERYLDNIKLLGRAENTISAYIDAFNFFKGAFKCPISKIKKVDIVDYIVGQQQEKGFNFITYFDRLKVVFNFAINDLQVIYNNPCKGVELPRIKEDNREKFITKELFKKVLDTCKDEKIKLYFKVAYYTGMRKSEILGLNLKDLKDCVITVRNQIVKGTFKDKLKTENSYRQVPISISLYNELKSAVTDINGYIFYDLNNDSGQYHLRKYNLSMHCFRYTRTSILVSEGIDLKYISYVIGDKIDTILNTYTKLNKDNFEKSFQEIRDIK